MADIRTDKDLYLISSSTTTNQAVVATDMDSAVSGFETSTSETATSATLSSSDVILVGDTVTVTVSISDAGAVSAGCLVYPATSISVGDMSQQVFTAIEAGAYSFSEWQDQDSTQLSTDNPAVINITSSITEIVGVFTL